MSPYSTGPHPTGPHTSGSTPRVPPGPGHPGRGSGWSTGQHRAYAPTLHSGSQPAYRPPTGQQAAYRPPTGQQPAYRPPGTGQQPAYQPPATGPQPVAHGPATGPQAAYRPPATGSQPAYGPGPATGQQPAYRSPATGQQPAYGPGLATGQQRAYGPGLATGQQPAYRSPTTGLQPADRTAVTGAQPGYGPGPATGQQPHFRSPGTGQQPEYGPGPATGQQPHFRSPGTGQQPAYRPPTEPQPPFRSPSTDPAVRPGGYVQPTYPPPSPAQHARSGRHQVLSSSPSLLPQTGHGPGPAASPLDWTGQLGGWSLGVANVHLDTTGAGETSLWGDRSDDPLARTPREQVDTGSFPRAQHTDHLWPSVTTDPFGVNTQAAVRAERRERSRSASFGFQLHMHTPRRARRHTVEFAEYWGLDHIVEAAELVVSELMTNALEASLPELDRQGVSMAVAPLELRLSAEDDHLRIEIRDHNPDPPVLEEPDLDEERGRGLLLVDSYCEVWGYHRLPTGGKVVWCLIGPPADA